jgi:hypothetical protein
MILLFLKQKNNNKFRKNNFKPQLLQIWQKEHQGRLMGQVQQVNRQVVAEETILQGLHNQRQNLKKVVDFLYCWCP